MKPLVLKIFDISNLANPILVQSYPISGNAVRVDVEGNLAFVAHDLGGLQIVQFQRA